MDEIRLGPGKESEEHKAERDAEGLRQIAEICDVAKAKLESARRIDAAIEAGKRTRLDAVGNFVGMPAGLMLEEFGSKVWSALGDLPYLVGSATQRKDWRDVDVRLIMSDEDFAAMFSGVDPQRPSVSDKWTALCMAFSALGKQMTGLPIDFQIQQQTYANKQYPEGGRIPLAQIELRYKK